MAKTAAGALRSGNSIHLTTPATTPQATMASGGSFMPRRVTIMHNPTSTITPMTQKNPIIVSPMPSPRQ